MSRDDIIRMAREAGLCLPYWDEDDDPKKDPPRWTMVSPLPGLLERFAALVAAHEREECAMLAYSYPSPDSGGSWRESIAAAIRARSDA